jgi:hypothetical protein
VELVWDYIAAVVWQFTTLATGVLMGVVELVARLTKKDVPHRLWLAILILWALMSPYLVWRAERLRADTKESGARADSLALAAATVRGDSLASQVTLLLERLAAVKSGTDSLEHTRRAAAERLAILLTQGDAIKRKCLEGEPPQDRILAWLNEVTKTLAPLGASYAVQFQSPPSGPTYGFKGKTEAQEQAWNFMNRQLGALTDLVRELRK